MSKNQIQFDAPNVGAIEKNYLNKAIDFGFVSAAGYFIKKFENRFARYLGVKDAVSTQSGTSAIHASLYELGIGPDDEVIVPVLTFAATVNPVLYVGAKPVFVDVDKRTWNIDPIDTERRITDRTKAVIPVHLYGNPCNMDEIMRIAKKYRLAVIEDATESLGAKYKGHYAGTFGHFGCFSFNGNKVITTGGGGMITGANKKHLEHIAFLVNQAKDKKKGFYHTEMGFNYRMTDIEAALGLAQLKQLHRFLVKKRNFSKIYQQELKKIDFIQFQDEYENAQSSWWLTCIFFKKDISIEGLQEKLSQKGIPTRRIFLPLTEHPPYRKFKNDCFRNAYQIYNRGLCLPGSTLNSEDDIYYVCKAIKKLL